MKSLKSFLITESAAEKWTAKAEKFLNGTKVKSLLSEYDRGFAEEVIDYIDGALYSFLSEDEYSYSSLEKFKEAVLVFVEESEGFFDELSEHYNIGFKEVAKIFKDVADLLRTVK